MFTKLTTAGQNVAQYPKLKISFKWICSLYNKQDLDSSIRYGNVSQKILFILSYIFSFVSANYAIYCS